MKNKKWSLITLLAVSLLAGGCKNTQQTQDTLAAMTALADSSMQMYVLIAVDRCKGDTNCVAKIERKFLVYTDAMNAAQSIFNSYLAGTTNRTAMLRVVQALNAARTDVTKAIIDAGK